MALEQGVQVLCQGAGLNGAQGTILKPGNAPQEWVVLTNDGRKVLNEKHLVRIGDAAGVRPATIAGYTGAVPASTTGTSSASFAQLPTAGHTGYRGDSIAQPQPAFRSVQIAGAPSMTTIASKPATPTSIASRTSNLVSSTSFSSVSSQRAGVLSKSGAPTVASTTVKSSYAAGYGGPPTTSSSSAVVSSRPAAAAESYAVGYYGPPTTSSSSAVVSSQTAPVTISSQPAAVTESSPSAAVTSQRLPQAHSLEVGDRVQARKGNAIRNEFQPDGKDYYKELDFGTVKNIANVQGEERVTIMWERTGLVTDYPTADTTTCFQFVSASSVSSSTAPAASVRVNGTSYGNVGGPVGPLLTVKTGAKVTIARSLAAHAGKVAYVEGVEGDTIKVKLEAVINEFGDKGPGDQILSLSPMHILSGMDNGSHQQPSLHQAAMDMALPSNAPPGGFPVNSKVRCGGPACPPQYIGKCAYVVQPDCGDGTGRAKLRIEATYSCHDGFVSTGGTFMKETMTLEEAKARCALMGGKGFTHAGGETDGPVTIYLKNKFDIKGTGWTSYKLEPDPDGLPAWTYMSPAHLTLC